MPCYMQTSVFNNDPEIFMYGMLCALTVAGVWLLIATYTSLAVSTTHSIIGEYHKKVLKWNLFTTVLVDSLLYVAVLI